MDLLADEKQGDWNPSFEQRNLGILAFEDESIDSVSKFRRDGQEPGAYLRSHRFGGHDESRSLVGSNRKVEETDVAL